MRTLHHTLSGLFVAIVISLVWTSSTPAAETSARILEVKGLVEVQSASAGRWIAAAAARPVLPGDAVRTGSQSSAVLLIDGARMTLYETTVLRIPAAATTVSTAANSVFRHPWLDAGRALFDVTPEHPARPFSVRTPTLVAGVKGTVFEVIAGGTHQAVYVWEGLVEVRSNLDPSDHHLVQGGEYIALDHLKLTSPAPIPVEREQPTYETRDVTPPAKPSPSNEVSEPTLTALPEPDTLSARWDEADQAAMGMAMDSLTDFQMIVSTGELRAPARSHPLSSATHSVTSGGASGSSTSTTTSSPLTTVTGPLPATVTDTVTPIGGVTSTLTDPVSGVVTTVTEPFGILGF